jgi:hypothetical protein
LRTITVNISIASAVFANAGEFDEKMKNAFYGQMALLDMLNVAARKAHGDVD